MDKSLSVPNAPIRLSSLDIHLKQETQENDLCNQDFKSSSQKKKTINNNVKRKNQAQSSGKYKKC
jgi:hypothetical protein